MGLKVASFATLSLAVDAAAAGSHRRGYVCEVWREGPNGWGPNKPNDRPDVDGWGAELVVRFRGPSTYFPPADDYRC